MSNQKSNSKKQRTHRTSAGIHGATHHPLTPVEKALLDKGQVQSVRHVDCRFPWRGANVVTEPWNPKNVAENRVLYPHLFMED